MSDSISGISPFASQYSSQSTQSTQLSTQEQDILQQLQSDPSQAAQLLQSLPKEQRHAIMQALEQDNPQAADKAKQALEAAHHQKGDGIPPQTGENFNFSA